MRRNKCLVQTQYYFAVLKSNCHFNHTRSTLVALLNAYIQYIAENRLMSCGWKRRIVTQHGRLSPHHVHSITSASTCCPWSNAAALH